MTLGSATDRASYNGDGSTTSFSVPFVFWTADDFEVILRSSAGAETTWTRGTQYTVTGGSGATGSIAVSTSPTDYTPASGTKLVIRSALPLTQSTSLPVAGPFPSASIEKRLDQLTRMIQQVDETVGRALRFPKTDSSSLSAILASSIDRASKFLAFDADGNPTTSAGSAGALTVSTFMATVLDDLTASAARSTLGISLGTTVDKYVDDSGAVGDGSTDDTSAFSTAIAALTAGDVLRLTPNKTYILDGTTSLNVASVTLDCRGATLKLKASAGNNAALLTIAANDVRVIGGTFNGNVANEGSATGQMLIYHTGRSRVHVNVDKMTGSLGYGFRAINATDCSCRVGNLDTCTVVGIQWEYSGSSDITRCITYDSIVDRSDDASLDNQCINYTKTGSATGHIYACAVVNCRTKMSNTPTGTSTLGIQFWGAGSRNKVIGCDVEGAEIGISLANGLTHSLVAGCSAFDQLSEGIEVADSTYCTIAGNVVDGNSNADIGISVDGTTTDAISTSVVGNTVLNTTLKGISPFSGCAGSTFVGNTIDIIAGTGIYADTSPDIEISGNTITGATAAANGIVLLKSGNIVLSGNRCSTGFTNVSLVISQNAAGTLDDVLVTGGYYPQGFTAQASGGGALGKSIRFVNCGGSGFYGSYNYVDVLDAANSIVHIVHTSSPEGVVTAGIGSVFIQSDGAAGSQLWLKESGSGNTGWRQQSNRLVAEVTVTKTDLATAGTKTLIAALSGAKWKIRNLHISGSGTNFSGGGGDRLLAIQDSSGTVVYSVLPVSTLASLWPYRWGDGGLPWPATAANLTAESTSGEALVAKYSGGTTDYSAGSLTLIVEYERLT